MSGFGVSFSESQGLEIRVGGNLLHPELWASSGDTVC